MADDWGQFIDKVHGESGRASDPAAQAKPSRKGPPPAKAPSLRDGPRKAAAAGRKGPARKGPPRKGPPRKGPPRARKGPPAQHATQRIRQEIDKQARIVPVEKIQQGGSKFVRVINPATLSQIVGQAVIAVLEERGDSVDQRERAQIEAQARKQFMDLLGEHQRVLAEKSKGDAERVKLEEARQRAEAEKEAATKEREQIERDRARALAEADKRRAELEQERIKALTEARTQREALEQAKQEAAREREALERERSAALEGKSQAEQQKGELAQQMELLRAEIEASREALAAERVAEAEAGPQTIRLSDESVTDVEYRVQALLDRMLRDGELGAGEAGEHRGLDDFERELGHAIGRVLAAARKDAGGGRSEAIELLERRIAKLNRALVDRQEAMEGLESGGATLHPRFRNDPVASTRSSEAASMSSALVGAGVELPPSYDFSDDDDAPVAAASEAPAEDPPVTAEDPPVTAEDPPVTAEDPPAPAEDPPAPAAPRHPLGEWLSLSQPGFSRLVTPDSRLFLWRCGAMRLAFLDTLAVVGLEPTADEQEGPFPTSSRLFTGGKVSDQGPAS